MASKALLLVIRNSMDICRHMNKTVHAVEMLQKLLRPSSQGPEHVSSSGNEAQTSLITIARNSPAIADKTITVQ